MFTSSLAVKELASLFTALYSAIIFISALLLATRLRSPKDLNDAAALLSSIVKETQKLPPPIVEVMNRAAKDVILDDMDKGGGRGSTIITKGWDIWLYSVSASSDPGAHADEPDLFITERYISSADDPSPIVLAFGAGSKTCLGAKFIRAICYETMERLLQPDIDMKG
ncbi:MAG: hypothetical protein M1827_002731 [Pycnora praestabilis]|nr:MAG: hypothetical protein M1827_002731 [Pycnora praestabilis]